MFVAIYHMFSVPTKAGEEKVAFGTFMQTMTTNPSSIKKVTIKGEHWTGEYSNGTRFRTVGPAQMSGELFGKLDKAVTDSKQAFKYEIEEKDENAWWTVVLGSWL